VTFEGVDGGTWDGLSYLFIGSGARLDHCVIRGANTGAALVETTLKVDNCVFESNVVGLTSGGFRSVTRGSRFIANATGISGPFNANGLTNPNTFAGNGVGVAGALEDTAVGNWWGDPSGPNAPNYAGGGDIIVGPVAFEPFLVSEPDPGVHPPTVRLLECPTPSYEPGAKVIFQWTIREDQDIAHQRILFSDFGHYPENFVVIADNLHPDVRSFEFVVPDVGIDVANEHQAFRIEAVDSAGRVGWDEQAMYISVEGLAGDVEFTSDFDQQFEPGSSLAVTWNSNNLDPLFTSGQATLLLDPDSEFVPLPSSSVSAGQLPALIEMPDVSTDSARIMLTATGGLNRRKVFFSPEFSIRPDARIGDAPPSITISSPSPVNFEGGTAVPIRWDASDDEGIRSFLIMASYDGGGVWRRITDDLPASTRAFAWQLPTSSGIDDVRLRVVARDTRFQNSSDSVSITITPGELTPGVNGDTNGDGVVNFTDLNTVLAGFGQTGAGLPGDLNGDGVVDFSDLNEVLTNFGA
jgi:hypothetical protein